MLSSDKKGRLSLKLRPPQHLQPNQRTEESCHEEKTCVRVQPCSGLSNLGNTCYCNAVLQTLRHCPGFSLALKGQDSASLQPSGENRNLIQELSQLIREMESSSHTITPVTFLEMLRAENEQFAGRNQHDAQELLTYLLTLSLQQRSGSSLSDDQPCHNLFLGQLAFLTRCFDCEKSTHRTEAFLHMSVPVIAQGLPGFTASAGPSQPTSAAPVSLSWCLSSFMSRERLAWSNKFWCDWCGHLVEAERSVLFNSLPQIFTVHLNRFSMQNWGRAVGKVTGKSVYYLRGVVLHTGTSCHSGHYTTVVRSSDQWLHCDDDIVTVLPDSVLLELLSPLSTSSASPYILFYCRL